MHNPLVTVVIPMYNAEDYLSETLDSLINQTYQKWKCIIVDDGSLDNSVRISQKYWRYDSRFQFVDRLLHTDISGANSCRNIGLEKVDTDWVIFVDADDLLEIDSLANRISIIQLYPSHSFYVFKTAMVDNALNIRGKFYNPNTSYEDIIYRLVKHQIPWHTMSPVWNTKFLLEIGGWNEEYERLQDVELNIRALLHRPKIYFSNSPIDSYYRLNPMTEEKKRAARFGFCRIIKDYCKNLVQCDWISKEYKEKLDILFHNLIEGQVLSYIRDTSRRDLSWEKICIQTLTAINLEEEEIKTIQNIFRKIV